MIPSRPLYLGDIVGNSFLIAFKTWTRSAIAALIFMVIPIVAILVTASGFLTSVHDALKTEGYLTPEKLEHFRVKIIDNLEKNNPALLQLYGIERNDEVTAAPDTVVSSDNGKADTERFVDKYGDSFTEYFYLALISYLLLILGSLGYQIVAIDLACRQFEERKLNLWQAIKDTLRSFLWINILQFLILIFILAFGLGVAVQISELLNPMIGAFIVFAAVIMTLITALRLLFAQPALVSENLGPLAALKRSWELSKGHSWRIFGTLIVFALIMFTVYVILSIPMATITSSSTTVFFDYLRGANVDPDHIFSTLYSFIQELVIVIMITTAIFASLSPSFLTVLYYDLRTRKDGPLMYHDDEHPPMNT